MLTIEMPEDFGRVLLARLDDIARCSEPGPGVTRRPFTPQHRAANQKITDWMQRAGLEVRLDAAGTLIGRRAGPTGSKTFIMGSHQDSIRQGGRYDGILGVALPILVLEHLRPCEWPFAVEIHAYADEEGVRFPTALLGPRGLAGTLDESVLKLTDKDGVSLADALADFGGQPDRLRDLRRRPADTIGYLEVHIEQGPVLEKAGQPVGVVTGICGIERWMVKLTGQTAHAGTTPMEMRRDAFAGAAAAALELEAICRNRADLVGVVGSLQIEPNVVNAIPGAVQFSVEIRAPDDSVRKQASDQMTEAIERLCRARGLANEVNKTYAQQGVLCDRTLSDVLAQSVASESLSPRRLISGATHDASAMADLCPVAMLFLRCRDGISHNPEEAIEAADVVVAAKVIANFLNRVSDREYTQ